MSNDDRAAKKAEELLPCFCGGVYEEGILNTGRHAGPSDDDPCPAYYRPAVAAELRETYGEIERLQKIHSAEGTFRCTCNSYPHSPNCGLDERLISQRAELARLRAATKAATKADYRELVTLCPECGPNVSVDEEGLCATCGATAFGRGIKYVAA